jgi:DNA-binding protein H-NS
MKRNDFHNLSVDELLSVREIINELLSSKITEERRELEQRMAKLSQFNAEPQIGFAKIPAKYQNPDNPTQTWAGRGKTPLWLAAALKKGRRKEDFLIKHHAVRTTSRIKDR